MACEYFFLLQVLCIQAWQLGLTSVNIELLHIYLVYFLLPEQERGTRKYLCFHIFFQHFMCQISQARFLVPD